MSDLQRKLQSKGLPTGLPPRPLATNFKGRGGAQKSNFNSKRDYSGLSWSNFWESKDFVETPEGKFCYYSRGGGSGIVTVVCLHGGGYSALTWSCLARDLTQLVECRVIALDLRGHGESVCSDENNLSGEQMCADICSVLALLPCLAEGGGLVLVGHSMGGALATLSCQGELPGLVGLVVIDVVEGTALDALSSMQTVLANRPRKFNSIEQAVEWCVRSGQVRNSESARVSMPGQIVDSEGRLAASLIKLSPEEDASSEANGGAPPTKRQHTEARDAIKEEDEDGEGTNDEKGEVLKEKATNFASPALPVPATLDKSFTWRIDLTATEPHWSGWFTGLSSKFLSCPASAKMLLLAGVDRLDRELTIGQMQGKFQMQVLPQVGHTVHEDSPEKVSEVLATFLTRHKLAKPTENFTPTFPAC